MNRDRTVYTACTKCTADTYCEFHASLEWLARLWLGEPQEDDE